jgi:hypothetical protein
MSFLSNRFRKKSNGLPQWVALDQEALRTAAAMEHLEDHGNLDSFPGSQNEKLALMMTARRRGLVRWNRRTRCYELSNLRRERSGTRRALRESDGRTDPPPASAASSGKRWTLGPIMAAIAGMAIGAAIVALLPGSSWKQSTREQAAVATGTKPSGTSKSAEQSDAGDLRAGHPLTTGLPESEIKPRE